MTGTQADRDRRVVRRTLRAGIATWAATAAVLLLVFTGAGGGGRAGLLAVTMGLVVGALVTTAWLLLSVLADLLGGVQPGRRRLWWTAGAFAFSFVSPALVLGAAGAG